MPELVLKLGDNVLQTYVFDKDVMSIGRSRDNDVVVENLSVSRNHARIRRQNGKYILTDLNSANGTYVNGVRVSKTEIVNEDVISIGKHKLFFNDQPVNEEKMIADAFGADRTVVVDRVPAPVLCISDGKLKGQEFQITKFETSVGKAPSNDIVLSDDWFLAKKQAVIIRRGNADYEIHDMGGFKRTKVNGVQINEPRALQSGDVLEFGNTRCVFQVAGDVPAPSGRVPQEMALDDSIFSSGVSYSESEAPAEAAGIETPFVASNEAAPVELEFEPELALDTDEMARAAIAADEKARAEARESMQSSEPYLASDRGLDAELDSARDNTGLSAAMGQPEHLSLDDEEPATQRAYAEAESEKSKSDQEEQPAALEVAEPDSFARAELAPESAVEELPAEVMAGVAQETAGQANASEAESAGAFAPGMPVTPLMPAPPAESQPAFVSASGGRSNRKKKRDQQRNAPAASSSGNGAEARPEDLPPSFEERASGDNLALAQSTDEAIDKHADLAEKSQPAAQPGTNPEEIALWEAALENRSPVIRRQAARMLKKLTGKDYEV